MAHGEGGGAHAAGTRAARNTAVRALGEIVGKFATLVTFAVLARMEGQAGLGILVFAMAFAQIATMPVDLGLDRYLLRRIAADAGNYRALFGSVLAAKAALTVAVVPVALVVAFLLEHDRTTFVTTALILLGFLLDAVSRTGIYVLTAFERGHHVATSVVAQRVFAAALSITALALGAGVEGAALGYVGGSAIGVVVTAVLLRRAEGPLPLRARRRTMREVARASIPFGAEDVLTVTLYKIDAVLLAALATSAIVGQYGGAYRLLESTSFITVALTSAFSAMFTYLTPDSDPPVRNVFERAVKAALVLLIPIAVVFATLPDQVSRLFYGEDFAHAGGPLRLLAPVVVLLGLAHLSSSLVASRDSPLRLVRLTGVMLVVNVALNLLLIPAWEADGAAAAMLATEVVLVAVSLRMCQQLVGRLAWARVLAGPVLAGAAMVGVMLAAPPSLLVAVPLGALTYVAVVVVVERLANPDDLAFVTGLVRGRVSPATRG